MAARPGQQDAGLSWAEKVLAVCDTLDGVVRLFDPDGTGLMDFDSFEDMASTAGDFWTKMVTYRPPQNARAAHATRPGELSAALRPGQRAGDARRWYERLRGGRAGSCPLQPGHPPQHAAPV
jgi:hypothetical protein